ncbi:MAG: PfkB family carbohydrate kinase [Chloroflexota bacterium]
MSDIDYLCIGHITRDLLPDGESIGGTVAYSSLTAAALQQRVAIVTSAEPSFVDSCSLNGVNLYNVPSTRTTTFKNIYQQGSRTQTLQQVARRISIDMVPEEYTNPRILHLGPVADEVDASILRRINADVIGFTPQGWHRKSGAGKKVLFKVWKDATTYLPLASVVIISKEDIDNGRTWELYRKYCRVLVVTNGKAGSDVYFRGEQRHFQPPEVVEIDPTGVGDIYSAAFFVRFLESGGDPWESGRFATLVAAQTVTREGLSSIPLAEEIALARVSGH